MPWIHSNPNDNGAKGGVLTHRTDNWVLEKDSPTARGAKGSVTVVCQRRTGERGACKRLHARATQEAGGLMAREGIGPEAAAGPRIPTTAEDNTTDGRNQTRSSGSRSTFPGQLWRCPLVPTRSLLMSRSLFANG